MYVVFYAYFKGQFSNLTLTFYPPYFMIFFAPSRNSIQIKGQKLLVPKQVSSLFTIEISAVWYARMRCSFWCHPSPTTSMWDNCKDWKAKISVFKCLRQIETLITFKALQIIMLQSSYAVYPEDKHEDNKALGGCT